MVKLAEEKNNNEIISNENVEKIEEIKEDLDKVKVADQATSNEALQSTVKTLQKIIAQKEETIERYQIMLKEDRDKHSQAACSLQDEIKVQTTS